MADVRHGTIVAYKCFLVPQYRYVEALELRILIPWPHQEYQLGRVQLASFWVGAVNFTGVNLYAWPRSPTWPSSKEWTNDLLDHITQQVVLGRSGPRFVSGDFNHPSELLPDLELWHQQGWRELQDLAQARWNLPPRPTFNGTSCIDKIFVSPELAAMLSHVDLAWEGAGHAPLFGTFEIPDLSHRALAWPKPGLLPWDSFNVEEWQHSNQERVSLLIWMAPFLHYRTAAVVVELGLIQKTVLFLLLFPALGVLEILNLSATLCPPQSLQKTVSTTILAVSDDGTEIHTEHDLAAYDHVQWTIADSPAEITLLAPNHLKVESDCLLFPGQEIQASIELVTPKDVFAELNNFWSKRWAKITCIPDSTWRRITAFSRAFLPSKPLQLEDLTAVDWSLGLKRFHDRSARGPDGYDRLDLQRMPPGFQAALLDLVNQIERTHSWPRQLTEGHAIGIPKVEDARTADALRPIVVTSVVHRCWSSIRARQVLRHLEHMATFFAIGFLPDREAGELWMMTQALIEISLITDADLIGHNTDISKAFDCLPRPLTTSLLRHFGLPDRLVSTWHNWLRGLRRRWTWFSHIGMGITSTTGYPQGCALSCTGMLAIDLAYHFYMIHYAPRTIATSFVDNYSLLANSVGDLVHGLVVQSCFFELWQLDQDLDKTYCWALVIVQALWPKIFHAPGINSCPGTVIQKLRTTAARALGPFALLEQFDLLSWRILEPPYIEDHDVLIHDFLELDEATLWQRPSLTLHKLDSAPAANSQTPWSTDVRLALGFIMFMTFTNMRCGNGPAFRVASLIIFAYHAIHIMVLSFMLMLTHIHDTILWNRVRFLIPLMYLRTGHAFGQNILFWLLLVGQQSHLMMAALFLMVHLRDTTNLFPEPRSRSFFSSRNFVLMLYTGNSTGPLQDWTIQWNARADHFAKQAAWKLVLRIGRRAAVKGRRRWLPREEEDMSTAWGVARSRQAQTETSGLARSGSLELMLPAEAHLLVHGRRRPALRALHHARRLEQSLVSYDRNSWQQLPTRELNSEEVRPAGENGPLILCLDTSGSMARKGGAPETVAKALVFECLRQAQQQKRRCCLFAFSTGEELKQMELDLTGDGLEGLLDFLSFAFHGGTSLNEVLTASVERLHRAQWQNADLLVVTDGEVPKPEASVLAELQEAKDLIGARVYGVVVGSQPGAVMVDLCSELYHFKRRGQSDPSESLDSKTWALRRVNVAMAAAFVAGERSRGAFAGQTLPSPRTCRTARYADGREAKYQIWDKRERQRRLEREKELESKMGKRFQWVGGRWLTKEESEAQSAKIETVYQESRLGDANLQLELKKHFQSRFLSPYPLRDVPQDVVAAQWAEETLGRFEDQLLSLLVRASREASRLGQRRFEPEAALLGLFRCPVGKEICRQGLGDCEDVTERCRQLLERCIRRSADSGAFDLEDLPFSPELRRLLEAVEAERARLQHEEAQVAHLALALTSPKFRPSWQALAELGVEPQALRPAALANLGGALAAAEAHAEAWLWDLCADVGPQPRRRPLKGLQVAYTTVSRGLVERSVEAKLLLLAALSGEHLFLLGSPGTAKSLLARRLSKVCEGSFFERLLTRFTVPEELFGPLSLSALEQDELRRKTKGYLPECDVAFIDEIFKANSSILNALLVILNERRFDNGDQRVEVPLWCAVAASNELPDTDELDALYDRFLLRRKVARISKRSVPDFLRQTLDQDSVGSSLEVGSGALLTIEDSWDLQRQAQAVDFPEELLEIIAELREFLAEESEPRFEVSDRRLARAARLLRIAAAAAGGKVVVEADLLLLRHMFWDRDPEQGQLVTEWLLRRLGDAGAGKKAWPFLLEGLQTRLRHGLKGPGLDAARRDLRSLQQAAARAMLRLAQIAHDAPSEVAEGPDRFFWLGEKERRQACELGRRCQEESQRLQDVLRETSVLIQLASVEDEQQREELLCRRLGMERATQKKEVRYDEWGDEI
ncbi:unnamed protein product [Effrenium voratum]|nr:unnamed protein product [Effrenium voratum]